MGKAKRRRRPQRKRTKREVGQAPGTLEVPEDAAPSRVRVIQYDAERIHEGQGLESVKKRAGAVTWVDVVGLGSLEVIRAVGERYGLHTLALEDVLHPPQRPKIEDYPGHSFVLLRAARQVEGGLDLEQISICFGEGFVVTFQEREGDAYEPVRDRLRGAKGRIRQRDAGYLAYALIDATVDAMFPLLDLYEEQLDELDAKVFRDPSPELGEQIHLLARELMALRRAVLPVREALNRVLRHDPARFGEDTGPFLRDCLDHLDQLFDVLMGQRELITALADGHLSSLGHRSNEVMKVLTMTATVFIPLSFIAGLYGMNFDPSASPFNMPELDWQYGYPAALGLMVAVALAMLSYFRRKRWL